MRSFLANPRRSIPVVLGLLVLLFATAACDLGGGASSVSQQAKDQQNNNDQSTQLHSAVPYPKLTWSNELWNQYQWYERLNKKSEVGYIYVIAYNLVFGPYQVIGKCSSTESQYSAPASVINPYDITGSDFSTSNGQQAVVVPAAQPDGSYGQNEAAIFCFLDDAAQTMVEFNSQWVWTEKPLTGMPTVPGSAVIPNGK